MDKIINDLAKRPRLLRDVTLAGPMVGDGAHAWPMWILHAGAPSFGAQNAVDDKGKMNGTVADHVHPVRVLTADQPGAGTPPAMRPRLFDLHLVVGAQNERYCQPEVAADNNEDPDRLLLGWTRSPRALLADFGNSLRTAPEGADTSDGAAPFVHVVAELLPEGLPRPDQQALDDPEHLGDNAIALAPLRLVAGRIGLRVNPKDRDARWLVRLGLAGVDSATKDWHTWPLIWLVPDGIEFDAKLPFPASAALTGRIVLRPEPGDGHGAFRAHLLAPADHKTWANAWNAIVPAAGDASERLAGLKFAARRGSKLPGFSWPVAIGGGGSEPMALAQHAVEVDGADCAVSLVSPPVLGAIESVAALRPARLQACEGQDGLAGKIVFKLADGAAPKSSFALRCLCAAGKFTLENTSKEKLSLDIELVRLAHSLRQAYGLPTPPPVPAKKDPGPLGSEFNRPLIPAFVALENGWLQLPIPNLGPLDRSSDLEFATMARTQPRNVLGGFLRVRHPGIGGAVQSGFLPAAGAPGQLAAPWSVTIEQAGGVAGSMVLTPGSGTDPARLESAEFVLHDPVLSTRGMLWLSADRPDAQEALPRLGAGPGAFIDVLMQSPQTVGPARSALTASVDGLAISVEVAGMHGKAALGWTSMALGFGVDNLRWVNQVLKPQEARDALKAAADCVVDGFKLTPAPAQFQAPLPAVAWLRHPAVPLAAAMPMTRAGSGSARPLESRDLMPFALSPAGKPPTSGTLPLALLAISPHPPLLALQQVDGASFALSSLPCWPEPTGKRVLKQPPERGIAFAMACVPGAELRVRNSGGTAPGYGKISFEAALRYDLPLLDEAFASAALPPPEDTAARSAALPDASVPTTLDWPLLAAFWQEQERKQQNCRVVDSYLSGFGAVDALNDVDVDTLVRTLVWRTSWQLDTRPVSGRPSYGALRLAGAAPVSGNSALAGYDGWFLPDLRRGELNLAQETTPGALRVRGFSPGTLHAHAMELDNALTGAAPAAHSPNQRLLERAVTVAGASTGQRLLSLAAPLDVTINGGAFQFWFKDVLFTHDKAELSGDPDAPLAFDTLDNDAKLAAAGFEWRFGAAGKEQAALTLLPGRSEIPFFGFRLEPLRLLALAVKDDELETAVLLCRLSLSPRTDSANLVRLTLTQNGAGQAIVAGFTLARADQPLRFALTARDTDNGALRRMLVTAQFTGGTLFGLAASACAIDVAGVMVELGKGTITPVADQAGAWQIGIKASPVAGNGEKSRLRISAAEVKAGYRIDGKDRDLRLTDLAPELKWTCAIELFPQGPHAAQTAALKFNLAGAGGFTLLGIDSAEAAINVEEANGALSGRMAGSFAAAGGKAAFEAAYVVRLATASGADGTVELVAGHCEGVLEQDQSRYLAGADSLFGPGIGIQGARLAFQVSTEKDGLWRGSATVSAQVDATSDIAWPALSVEPGQPVPLPMTNAKPRTGRVLVNKGAGASATHHVQWTLSGHSLALDLAAAVMQRDSRALWVVPAMARHSLKRGARQISWTGVESLAVGRPAGVIPRPAPDQASEPVLFAPRYRRSITKGSFGSYEPGMLRAGLGGAATVLQGALGGALRKLYWAGSAAEQERRNRLMLGGGYLGLLTLAPAADAAPLLRLPLLAGSGVALAQEQFGADGIELAWSDGAAARAVALSRPTAPSPANASYEALAAALVAGSLVRAGASAAHAQLAGSLLVEQSFDHRPQGGPATLAAGVFFAAAAVTVDAVLKLPQAPHHTVTSLSLVAASLVRSDARPLSLAASVAMGDVAPQIAPAPDSACLYVLGATLRRADWHGSAAAAELPDAVVAYLRALAATIDPDPAAFMLVQGGAASGRRYLTGAIASLALDSGRAHGPGVSWFPDGGRGLPAAPAPNALRWLAPVLEGPARPIRDANQAGGPGTLWTGSGLAGLARDMSLPASAAPAMALNARGEAAPVVWLAQTQVPVYLALQLNGLRGAPVSWLQHAPPLVRLPTDIELATAVRASAPRDAANASDALQSFMPAWLGAAAIGERAGIMTLRRVRLLTRLDAPGAADIGAYDAMHARFGAPAQAGSSFARKLRTPRPGPLPVNLGDPARDRRVQASSARPLAAGSAVLGSADLVQGGRGGFVGGDRFHSWAVEVVASPETASVVSERWDGSLRLVCRIDVRFELATLAKPASTPASFLATVLMLTANASSARLKIGAHVTDYHWLLPEPHAAGISWSSSASGGIVTHSASVILTLDPRQLPAPHQTPAVLGAIGVALSGSVALPPVELQWTVKPGSARPLVALAAVPIALDASARNEGRLIEGDAERAPLTLRMPLYPALSTRGALPMTPASLVFSDPAYNRDLAGPPAAQAAVLSASGGDPQRGALRMILSADRARVNTRGVLTLMLDIAYEKRLDELAQAAAEKGGAGPGGDLAIDKVPAAGRLTIRLVPVDGKPRPLRLTPAASATGLELKPGTVYELPLAVLLDEDGTPVTLRAGDVLQLTASLTGAPNLSVTLFDSTSGKLEQVAIHTPPPKACTLTLTLTEEAVVEPPPALYLALQRSLHPPGKWRMSMPLHAQSPLPRRVDLMDPARGFRTGLMTRNADFVWYLSSPATMLQKQSLAIHKSDRNGQGYWPEQVEEFLTPENRNLKPYQPPKS
jgi:hypothetical protein